MNYFMNTFFVTKNTENPLVSGPLICELGLTAYEYKHVFLFQSNIIDPPTARRALQQFHTQCSTHFRLLLAGSDV